MLFQRENPNPYRTVLWDGTSVIDMKRLLQDPKVQETLRKLSAKIKNPKPLYGALHPEPAQSNPEV